MAATHESRDRTQEATVKHGKWLHPAWWFRRRVESDARRAAGAHGPWYALVEAAKAAQERIEAAGDRIEAAREAIRSAARVVQLSANEARERLRRSEAVHGEAAPHAKAPLNDDWL